MICSIKPPCGVDRYGLNLVSVALSGANTGGTNRVRLIYNKLWFTKLPLPFIFLFFFPLFE